MKQLFCPISTERVNEHVPRVTALYVVLTVTLGMVFSSLAVIAFVAADFFIRAFTKLRFSPLSCAAYWTVELLKIPAKPIDKAPKVFAARMGFVMSLMIAVLMGLNFPVAALFVAGILLFFASLEFAFAFCAGCTIYTYLVLPLYKN
ncbi:DUF4395 domain-containing protein [Sunxiuqinia elliptica]|uniref:Uncharacterized protein DUF4395 n=1 Tax=Sunxiuqinia elliptica TaxID=655355 RepID=A0A4R6H6M3_9BACT|nr:DUF4395 domain-containing protein [Sunxiuqinia elliptica]TDO03993.1 uncharacterized protein DUF4395 [Sunxiuqinia elliptica]TDO62275.1 uncharacterized protein DUF4395 [Sunxiuqinia elliptica]